MFSDLQLAAELGKTLLERNKDLETQLAGYQQENYELQLENEVGWLWSVVDSNNLYNLYILRTLTFAYCNG